MALFGKFVLASLMLAVVIAQTPTTGLWECVFKCEPDVDQCYYKGICKSGTGVSPMGPCTKSDYDQVCGLGVPFYPQDWMRPAAFYGDDEGECEAGVKKDSGLTCHPDWALGNRSRLEDACPIVEADNWRDCNNKNPHCWWCEMDDMCVDAGKVPETNYDPSCGMPQGQALPAPQPADDSEWVCTYICSGDSVFRCMDSCPDQYAGCDKGQSYQVTSTNCETFIDRIKQYGGSNFDTRTSADVSVSGKGLMMAVQDHLSKHLRADGTLALQISDQDIQGFLQNLEKKGLSTAEDGLCEWAGGGGFCGFIVDNPLTHYINDQIVNWPPAQDLTHSVVDLAHGDVKDAVGDVVNAVNTGVGDIEDVCKKAGHAISNFVRNIFSSKKLSQKQPVDIVV
eukprot:gnl/TRDRNA2_/TRDRNA2_166127_c0_seq1.p1 gnl/TRDRNA2_/TRDRNA2_166127_c0~~gnl/TRDRNA2_/TRDRNA2_166127_c0_seq1.p1  ORF type:complete len:417 (-),score=74.53 gnl/TRDRNA2_/TRDRNA2_166127_c0_seq1:75-1259(-)